jgi:hypothetical protein
MRYHRMSKYLELGLQDFNVIQPKLLQKIQYFKEFDLRLIKLLKIFNLKHN